MEKFCLIMTFIFDTIDAIDKAKQSKVCDAKL